MSKKRALVIAPGRGTYNKAELGYLRKHHADKSEFIGMIDDYRRDQGQVPVSDLDGAERYSLKEHTRGDQASPLIYACAYGDYQSIDRDRFDVVAVTGNSMGWYIALACAGAASPLNATKIINAMGTMMQDALIGGQMLYPFVDENWQEIPGKQDELFALIDEVNALDGCDLALSIKLGGMLVFGGNDLALGVLKERLPVVQERFPMILPNHAAFHTVLQKPVSEKAFSVFDAGMFGAPEVSLIDGRGYIWRPHITRSHDIYDYTLGTQVFDYYDFTKAVQVSVKEFAPDCIIVLGPGTTLGGAIAQSLIDIEWEGLRSKADFIARQSSDAPLLYAMGMDEQRALVV